MEKPRKNLTQETCPDRGSNPGLLRDRRACCRLAHSGGLHLRNSRLPGLTCWERKLTLDHIHTFLTTQGHGGPPPRQHKHERQYTPSTHSVIPTRRIGTDGDEGQMIFGDLRGLKFPDICLTGEEKPRKNLSQETWPDRGSNPGPLRDRRACCRLAHSGGLCRSKVKIICRMLIDQLN